MCAMLARCFVLDIFGLDSKIKASFIFVCFLALLLVDIADYGHFEAIGGGIATSASRNEKSRHKIRI